jgi:hypothetical protein
MRYGFWTNSSALVKMWIPTGIVLLALIFSTSSAAKQFFKNLPTGFENGNARWAWISYEMPSVAVIPGTFNRSAFDAPHVGKYSDPGMALMCVYLVVLISYHTQL